MHIETVLGPLATSPRDSAEARQKRRPVPAKHVPSIFLLCDAGTRAPARGQEEEKESRCPYADTSVASPSGTQLTLTHIECLKGSLHPGT